MKVDDPTGYGRVVRDENGNVKEVVEQKDASPEILKVNEINSGVYCFDSTLVFEALAKVRADNAQKEYYLPDVLKIFLAEGRIVRSQICEDKDEILGVNTPEQLARAEECLAERAS